MQNKDESKKFGIDIKGDSKWITSIQNTRKEN